jgi:hypothetical protein
MREFLRIDSPLWGLGCRRPILVDLRERVIAAVETDIVVMVRRGQRLARHFWRHWADSGRQRPRYPASPAAKPRKVKDYSDGHTKAALRGLIGLELALKRLWNPS